MLFPARNGSLHPDAGGPPWTIKIEPTRVLNTGGQPRPTLEFDRERASIGTSRGWLSAMRVFAYPENQLLPALDVARPGELPRTTAFRKIQFR